MFDLVLQPRPAHAARQGGAVRDGGVHPRLRQLPGPGAHGPGGAGPGASLNMPVKVLRTDGSRGRNRAPDEAAWAIRGLDRVQVDECRGRRHRRRRRPHGCNGARHRRRARDWPSPLHRHPGRSADPRHDLPRQRRPARPGARARRSPPARSATASCVNPKATSPSRSPKATRCRRVRGRRPRRTPTRRADRDRCAAKASSSTIGRPRVLTRQERGNRRARGAVRGSPRRRGRTLFRRRRGKDEPPQGPDAGHAPLRRRQGAPHLHHAQPRPDRLPQRVPHRHARHRHHEPPVRRLSDPWAGADGGPPQRLA